MKKPSKPTPVAEAAAQTADAPKQQAQQEQYIAYPLSFVNALVGNLAKRPWEEVNGLIQGLEKLGVGVELPPAPAKPAE